MSEHRNNDKEAFEDYLKGTSDLSDSYAQLPEQLPPSALDDAILAASRRAVQSRPQVATGAFYQRWKVPLSMAATVFLCVGLVTVYYQQSDEVMLRQMDPLPALSELTLDEPKQTGRQQAQPMVDADQSSITAPSGKQLVEGYASEDSVAGLRVEAKAAGEKAQFAEQQKREVERRPSSPALQEIDALVLQAESEESFYDKDLAPAVNEMNKPQPSSLRQEKKKAKTLTSPRADTAVLSRKRAPAFAEPEVLKERRMRDDLMSVVPPATEQAAATALEVPALESDQALFDLALPAEADSKPQRPELSKQDVAVKRSLSDLKLMRKSTPTKSATAEVILRRISLYRARGQFQQADDLLKRFHQQYPGFPAAHRERILDSVAPLVSAPEQL